MCDKSMEVNMQPEKTPIVPRDDTEKQQLTNRLKRIEGQVRGLQKMVEDDRYCVDVLVQLSAVNAALKKVGYSLMERRIKAPIARMSSLSKMNPLHAEMKPGPK